MDVFRITYLGRNGIGFGDSEVNCYFFLSICSIFFQFDRFLICLPFVSLAWIKPLNTLFCLCAYLK